MNWLPIFDAFSPKRLYCLFGDHLEAAPELSVLIFEDQGLLFFLGNKMDLVPKNLHLCNV